MKLCPLSYFVNNSGAPAAGGTITTYITGTSTLKATYTDASGGTPLANPITIPSNGYQLIWLNTDTAYRLVIKDSNGTTLNTIDNVVGVTTLAASTGGANLDMTGYQILTTGNANLDLYPGGSGAVTLHGIALPNNTPSVGQVITATSASGSSWQSAPGANINTTVGGVTITSPTNHQILTYNGSAWVNQSLSANTDFTGATWTSAAITDLATSSVTFSNKAGNISQWTNDVPYTTASSTTTFTNKSGSNNQWTNDAGYLVGTAASKSDMQTATSTTKFPNAAQTQNHPGVAKAWCNVTTTAGNTVTVNEAYNITAAYNSGTNVLTLTFTTPFANTTYQAPVIQYREGSIGTYYTLTTKNTGSITYTLAAGSVGGNLTLAFFGTQ